MKKIFAIAALLTFSILGGTARAERARILFIGDIMAHKQQLEAAERGKKGSLTWDFKPQFQRVKPFLENAFVVGNLETTFAGPKNYAGYPQFNTPDSLTDALSDLGIDLLTLANNHIFDRGAKGARRTTEVLDRAGLPWIGLGLRHSQEGDEIPANDAILLEAEGLRWAFVSYTYGSNLFPKNSDVHLNIISEAAIAEGMARARALNPDVIVACFHWGNEYHYKPSVHQRKAAEQAIAEGAHLVIGTHPHVLQPVEVQLTEDGARAVAWSLGNFVSFQRTLPRERTCILSAEFEKDEVSGATRLARLSTAPLQVILTPNPRRRRTEPVYAGTGIKREEPGLSKEQMKKVRQTGRTILEFLGARDEVDEYGFYTLWDEASPDVLPSPRRKAPLSGSGR